MKYKYLALLNENNMLSHLFLNCLSKQTMDRIILENKTWTKKQVEKREIEIEVKIDGVAVDPKKFVDIFKDQYVEHVNKTADELFRNMLTDKFNSMRDKLDEYSQVIESWANDINWDIPNPFKKEQKNG